MDFLNTAFAPDGVRMEAIPDGKALLAWMVGAQLIEESAVRTLAASVRGSALDSAALEARKLRERTRHWLERWRVAPRGNYSEDVAALNERLGRGIWRREVVSSKGKLQALDRLELDTAEALLAMIAWHIGVFVTTEDPALLKQCAGPGCTLWFLDKTRAHHRRFCSAAVCGNRAKVAAFRERQRG